MSKEIPLSRGMFAVVDDDDFERANKHKWHVVQKGKRWYAARVTPRPNRKTIYLHRYLLDAPPDRQVDHKNMDGLDCRRDNIRVCTASDNQRNKETRSDNGSGYKGVSWKSGKWVAVIKFGHKNTYIGRFESKEDAARAYDSMAREHHGEFARLNFPQE